jgi:hypothetical protein
MLQPMHTSHAETMSALRRGNHSARLYAASLIRSSVRLGWMGSRSQSRDPTAVVSSQRSVAAPATVDVAHGTARHGTARVWLQESALHEAALRIASINATVVHLQGLFYSSHVRLPAVPTPACGLAAVSFLHAIRVPVLRIASDRISHGAVRRDCCAVAGGGGARGRGVRVVRLATAPQEQPVLTQ